MDTTEEVSSMEKGEKDFPKGEKKEQAPVRTPDIKKVAAAVIALANKKK
jgi:hypothetical protein